MSVKIIVGGCAGYKARELPDQSVQAKRRRRRIGD